MRLTRRVASEQVGQRELLNQLRFEAANSLGFPGHKSYAFDDADSRMVEPERKIFSVSFNVSPLCRTPIHTRALDLCLIAKMVEFREPGLQNSVSGGRVAFHTYV